MNFIGRYLYGLKCMNAIKMISSSSNISESSSSARIKCLRSLFDVWAGSRAENAFQHLI